MAAQLSDAPLTPQNPQIRVVRELPDGIHSTPTIKEGVNRNEHSIDPRYTGSYWPPNKLSATNHHSSDLDIQPVFNPPHFFYLKDSELLKIL